MVAEYNFLEKILFPIVERIVVWYVWRRYLLAKEKDLPKKKAQDILKSARFRPTNSMTVTGRSLNEIKEAIVSFLQQDIKADERKFGINFLNDYTKDMTIEELLKSLRIIDPRSLASIVKAIVEQLQSDPAVKLISTRDVFSNIVRKLESECKTSFETVELLEPHLGHKNDQVGYLSQLNEDDLVYGGLDPEIANNSPVFKNMRHIQKEMKTVGRKTAMQKCSRTHIVMSTAIGDVWLKNSNSGDRYMVITAEKTDKTNLLIPSETPVVRKYDNKFFYYGDSSARPSSELLSHWTMHEELSRMEKKWSNLCCIFHAHLIDVVEFSRRYDKQSKLLLGDKEAPNIDWFHHGTSDLGRTIIERIVENNSDIAVVKDHGPWFFAPTLLEAYEKAIKTVNNIKSIREQLP